jgi:hypothetical protein
MKKPTESQKTYKQLPGKQGMVFLKMPKWGIYCIKLDYIRQLEVAWGANFIPLKG